ncbi:hypothetical protein CPB86DRAFT_799156 [Serendipita vermifera]|nr:hypothetical protein CPB86DRAFT_799156 [Serendipita vermifera]
MSQYGYIMAHPPAHYTHPRLQIRTAQDAHRVFEAVRQGILPLIRRRLSPSERDLLASGQVFVWEEAPTGAAAGDEISQTTSGLERWTDGRRWSQSRMREPFLFYEEKVQTTAEERQAKADRRARKASSSDSQSLPNHLLPIRRQDRPSKPDGLTKQTYSCQYFSRIPAPKDSKLTKFLLSLLYPSPPLLSAITLNPYKHTHGPAPLYYHYLFSHTPIHEPINDA